MEAEMAAIAATPRSYTAGRPVTGGEARSPWASDFVLMNLSIWWVQHTRPATSDFGQDVAAVMRALQDEVR
jgi:hypothetical protein